jgi:hypothetical protein
VIELFPPEAGGAAWRVKSLWKNLDPNSPDQPKDVMIEGADLINKKFPLRIPFDSATTPGMRGTLRFDVSAWNPDAVLPE